MIKCPGSILNLFLLNVAKQNVVYTFDLPLSYLSLLTLKTYTPSDICQTYMNQHGVSVVKGLLKRMLLCIYKPCEKSQNNLSLIKLSTNNAWFSAKVTYYQSA